MGLELEALHLGHLGKDLLWEEEVDLLQVVQGAGGGSVVVVVALVVVEGVPRSLQEAILILGGGHLRLILPDQDFRDQVVVVVEAVVIGV